MQVKHLFLATALTSLLVTATYAQSPTGTASTTETSSRRVQTTAPILDGQANLSATKVDEGTKSGKLSETQPAEAKAATHFDTSGGESDSNGVTN